MLDCDSLYGEVKKKFFLLLLWLDKLLFENACLVSFLVDLPRFWLEPREDMLL